MRFGSRGPAASLLIPSVVALIGLLTQEWVWAATGAVGLVAVIGLRVWAARTAQPGDGFAGVVAVFVAIAAAFLAGALYLWLAVGGAGAAIIGMLAMGVALVSAYMAYAIGYTNVTGNRAPGAARMSAAASYLLRDIRLRL
jgi:hypothetical protein